MRLRSVLTMLFGIIIAGSAVFYTRFALQTPKLGPVFQDVVIAAEGVAFGQVVTEEQLMLQQWPMNALPDGVFVSLDQVLGKEDGQKPRRAKRTISAGEVLLEDKVSDFGEQVTITEQIDPGMRAMTVRVNDVTGVAGLIAPSDRIDLTLTRTIDRDLSTSTILQNVQVLGLDQGGKGAKPDPSKIRTVTVQVTPVDAQKLALAQQAGTISLSLRHIDAADMPILSTISVKDLSEEEKPTPKVRSSGLPSIIVNRGGTRTTVEVPSG